jgi:hypothetical protein
MKSVIPLSIALAGFLLTQGEASLAQKRPIAIVLELKGTVEVLRDQPKARYQVIPVPSTTPDQPNFPLYKGDLIRVQPGSRGVVQCLANSQIWTVPDDGLPRGVASTCP